MEKLNINGVEFEVIRNAKNYALAKSRNSHHCGETLFDHYRKPSAIKINTYNNWAEFVKEIGANTFGVLSGTSSAYSLGFNLRNMVFYITKDHNRVYIIE